MASNIESTSAWTFQTQKQAFDEYMKKFELEQPRREYYSREEYKAKIVAVLAAKLKHTQKTSAEYNMLRTMDVITIDKRKVLIKKQNERSHHLYYVPKEDYFNIIETAHHDVEHGGINATEKEINKRYANVPRLLVSFYLSQCPICSQKKKKFKRTELTNRPSQNEELNQRGQIDLIDLESYADGEFKWIMHYQDLYTKYSFLRALKSKEPNEVATNLFQIFIDFGAPLVLHSNNRKRFIALIIKELKFLWPNLYIINGRSRNRNSQDHSNEESQHIERILSDWLNNNKSKRWSVGLPFVQMIKNQSYHAETGSTSYNAMFGRECPQSHNSLDQSQLQLRKELSSLGKIGEKNFYEVIGVPDASSSDISSDSESDNQSYYERMSLNLDIAEYNDLFLSEEETSISGLVNETDVLVCKRKESEFDESQTQRRKLSRDKF